MTMTTDEMRAGAWNFFKTAKRFYAWSLSMKATTFLLGVWTALAGLAWWIPVLLLVLSFGADGLLLMSDNAKGKAEDLMRRLEFWDGFGWPPSERDLRQVPLIRNRPADSYFASDLTQSPARAMANLEEQAWWSRELYQRIENLVLTLLVATVGTTIIVLLIVALNGQATTGRRESVRLVIATLNILLSAGLIKLYIGYRKAAVAAATAEQTGDRLKKEYASTPQLSPVEAVRAYHTYQLARASAPLIPDTVYNRYRDDLNQRWDRKQGDTVSSSPST